MPPVRNLRPGYTVIYPNRAKASSKMTKAIVVLILLISVGLMLIVTIGGWSKLEGMKPVNFFWCLAYVVAAFYIARWNRGLLPMAAALAMLLLILAVIAGVGVAGTSWFDRSHFGYAATQTPFGGKGLGPDAIGTVILILAPVQALLIFFCLRGFGQRWNVEQEVPETEADQQGFRPGSPQRPVTA